MSPAEPAGRLPVRLPRGLPKGRAVREIVEALVASLEPGAPLPSERLLADRYGVARMTVRSELDRLVAEGIVYRLHGRGSFVAEPHVAQAGLFSSFSEDMRARGLTPGSIVRSQKLTAAGPLLANRLEVAPGAQVVEIERLRTADGVPLALERAHLSAERFPGAAEADLEHGSLFELLAGYGISLTRADQRVLAVAIDAGEAELLGLAPGAPGLRFETLARDAERNPVYYATSLYRGDRYEIELRQARPERKVTPTT
jgi:DNA-binding GntR family transcriptional regulator